MSPKAVGVLGLVTAFVVVAAVIAQVVQGRGGPPTLPERVLPGLESRLDDVTRLEIEGTDEQVALERGSDGWVIASKGGYPTTHESVRDLMVTMARLEPVEPKTSSPELYSRIRVDEPENGSGSVRIKLFADDDDPLASLIVGSEQIQGMPGTFVRVDGQARSWLAAGRLNPESSAMQWIDRDVLELERDRIQRVTVSHADGDTILLARESADQPAFTFENVPEGRQATPQATLGTVTNALGFVTAEDVASDDAVTESEDVVVARYETFDEITVEVRTWTVDDAFWASITASTSSEQGTVRSEVEQLNSRLEGWSFRLAEFKARNFRKRSEDLLLPAEEEPGQTPEVGPFQPEG